MSRFNKVILVGRLTRDPEIRYTQEGTPVANFSMAVDRDYKSQDGERPTDFFKVTCWRKLAEIVGQHLTKGSLILMEGQLRHTRYEKDGETRTSTEINADSIQFLQTKKKEGDGGDGGGGETTDDIPF